MSNVSVAFDQLFDSDIIIITILMEKEDNNLIKVLKNRTNKSKYLIILKNDKELFPELNGLDDKFTVVDMTTNINIDYDYISEWIMKSFHCISSEVAEQLKLKMAISGYVVGKENSKNNQIQSVQTTSLSDKKTNNPKNKQIQSVQTTSLSDKKTNNPKNKQEPRHKIDWSKHSLTYYRNINKNNCILLDHLQADDLLRWKVLEFVNKQLLNFTNLELETGLYIDVPDLGYKELIIDCFQYYGYKCIENESFLTVHP